MTTVSGFSTAPHYRGGHDFGATSVDEGRGLLFVTDRTSERLYVVDPARRRSVSFVHLGAHPDYVRWVEATGELWVTEPDASRIEIFTLPDGDAPEPAAVATIAVAGGPESLVIDAPRHRAYTHLWHRSTVAIDLATRSIVATWPNGCEGSRGIALDAEHGLLLAGCSEGKVSALDVAHDGQTVSTLSAAPGQDVIGYAPALGHVYLAGGRCRCLVIVGLSSTGQLTELARLPAPRGTHCVTADDSRHAWVCDPSAGAVTPVADTQPSSR